MKKKRWVAFLWMLMGLSACSSLNQKPLHVEESKNINKTEPMPSDPPSTELVDPNLSSDLDSQPVDEGQEELLLDLSRSGLRSLFACRRRVIIVRWLVCRWCWSIMEFL